MQRRKINSLSKEGLNPLENFETHEIKFPGFVVCFCFSLCLCFWLEFDFV